MTFLCAAVFFVMTQKLSLPVITIKNLRVFREDSPIFRSWSQSCGWFATSTFTWRGPKLRFWRGGNQGGTKIHTKNMKETETHRLCTWKTADFPKHNLIPMKSCNFFFGMNFMALRHGIGPSPPRHWIPATLKSKGCYEQHGFALWRKHAFGWSQNTNRVRLKLGV